MAPLAKRTRTVSPSVTEASVTRSTPGGGASVVDVVESTGFVVVGVTVGVVVGTDVVAEVAGSSMVGRDGAVVSTIVAEVLGGVDDVATVSDSSMEPAANNAVAVLRMMRSTPTPTSTFCRVLRRAHQLMSGHPAGARPSVRTPPATTPTQGRVDDFVTVTLPVRARFRVALCWAESVS